MRTASLLLFLALTGSAAAAVIDGGDQPAVQASAVAAAGNFSFANSRGGMPIFSATGIAPGDSAAGTVEIANEGELPGELVLSQHDVEDTPGLGGGELSGRLSVRIADVTVPASPVTVYAGPLAPMPPRPAGRLQPGQSRTYELRATLPEAGPGGISQNDLQGASTSVAYAWTAGEVTAEPEPAPPAGPVPGPTESGPPAGGAAAPAREALRLRITRVRHELRGGRLVVWARCDSACRISVRGLLRARDHEEGRRARLHLAPRPRFAAGTQKLRIHVRGPLRRWLRAGPGRTRLTAHLALRARDQTGGRAYAQRTVRVHGRDAARR